MLARTNCRRERDVSVMVGYDRDSSRRITVRGVRVCWGQYLEGNPHSCFRNLCYLVPEPVATRSCQCDLWHLPEP